MARSSMSTQQKISILSNELTRRLYNINKNGVEQEEIDKVVDTMTRVLNNSEYNVSTMKEIIVSGIRGWKTRIKRREQKGQPYYRPGYSTVKMREYKKLMSRENWYQDKIDDESEEKKTPKMGEREE